MRTMKTAATLIVCASALLGAAAGGAPSQVARTVHASSFAVSYPAARSAAALDGRIILLLSRDLTREPRSHVSPDEPLESPYMFGLNVAGLAGGHAVVLDDGAFGWPARKLSQVPAGDYLVQAVLNRYETYHMADGRILKLAPDKGEGQQWALKPGNLYSTPIPLHIDPAHPVRTALELSNEIGPISAQDRLAVRPPHPHPQRAAVEVLGPRCVPRRARPGAEGLRQASRGALPADGLPRPLPG